MVTLNLFLDYKYRIIGLTLSETTVKT